MADQATAAGVPPRTADGNPMAVHVKVIALIELAYAGFAFLAACFAFAAVVVGASLTNDAGVGWATDLIATFGLLIVALFAGLAILALVGGLKLLKLRRSGKGPTYVTAALALFSFPVGTAFGVYTFVILSRPDTDRLLANP